MRLQFLGRGKLLQGEELIGGLLVLVVMLMMVNGDVDAVDDGDDLQVEGMAKLVAFLKEGWGVSFQGNRALVLNEVHGLVSL